MRWHLLKNLSSPPPSPSLLTQRADVLKSRRGGREFEFKCSASSFHLRGIVNTCGYPMVLLLCGVGREGFSNASLLLSSLPRRKSLWRKEGRKEDGKGGKMRRGERSKDERL